ncbi:unnamed protein product [Ectocarpus sp. CCAP 1310/34]|nr:unnamed protein product [Ectocarpus sp. CCAP 1310/34]
MYDDVKDRILFHPMLSRGTLEETLRLAEHEQRIKRRSGAGIEDTRHAPVAAGVGRGGGMRIAAAAGADGGPSHERRSAFFCQVHGANSSHNTPDCHKLRQDYLFHYNDFMAFIRERDSMRGPGFPQARGQDSGRLSGGSYREQLHQLDQGASWGRGRPFCPPSAGPDAYQPRVFNEAFSTPNLPATPQQQQQQQQQYISAPPTTSASSTATPSPPPGDIPPASGAPLRLFHTSSVKPLGESDSVTGNEIGVVSDGEVSGVPVAGMSVLDVPVVPAVNPAITSQAPVSHTRMSTPKGGEQLQEDKGTSAGMFDAREGVAFEHDVAVLGRAEQMDVDVFHHRAGHFPEPILSMTAEQQGNTLPRELEPGNTAASPPSANAATWPAVAAATAGTITASPPAAAAVPWGPATADATSSSPSHTAGGAPWNAAAATDAPSPLPPTSGTALPATVTAAAPSPLPPTSGAAVPLVPSPGATALPRPRTTATRTTDVAAAASSSPQHTTAGGTRIHPADTAVPASSPTSPYSGHASPQADWLSSPIEPAAPSSTARDERQADG